MFADHRTPNLAGRFLRGVDSSHSVLQAVEDSIKSHSSTVAEHSHELTGTGTTTGGISGTASGQTYSSVANLDVSGTAKGQDLSSGYVDDVATISTSSSNFDENNLIGKTVFKYEYPRSGCTFTAIVQDNEVIKVINSPYESLEMSIDRNTNSYFTYSHLNSAQSIYDKYLEGYSGILYWGVFGSGIICYNSASDGYGYLTDKSIKEFGQLIKLTNLKIFKYEYPRSGCTFTAIVQDNEVIKVINSPYESLKTTDGNKNSSYFTYSHLNSAQSIYDKYLEGYSGILYWGVFGSGIICYNSASDGYSYFTDKSIKEFGQLIDYTSDSILNDATQAQTSGTAQDSDVTGKATGTVSGTTNPSGITGMSSGSLTPGALTITSTGPLEATYSGGSETAPKHTYVRYLIRAKN